jgi:hypothetical protein
MQISTLGRAVRTLVALGACSLGSATAASAQGVSINMRAWRDPVLMDTLRQDHELTAAPEKVYEATLKAFGDLGIPAGRTDGKAGIIGSERFERMNSLGGSPMSRWFDCGESPTGPNANSLRLEIAVVVWVAPASGGTKIGLATIASGRDVAGVSRALRPCASTGALEGKVLAQVTKLVGG